MVKVAVVVNPAMKRCFILRVRGKVKAMHHIFTTNPQRLLSALLLVVLAVPTWQSAKQSSGYQENTRSFRNDAHHFLSLLHYARIRAISSHSSGSSKIFLAGNPHMKSVSDGNRHQIQLCEVRWMLLLGYVYGMGLCAVISSANWINVFLHTFHSVPPTRCDIKPEGSLYVTAFATRSHYVSVKKPAGGDCTTSWS